MNKAVCLSLLFFLCSWPLFALPDWSTEAELPASGQRSNIYNVSSEKEWRELIRQGRLHALHYPVEITQMLVPYGPLATFFSEEGNGLKKWLQKQLGKRIGLKSMDDMYRWLGLTPYPQEEGGGAYFIPFKNGQRPRDFMGATLVESKEGKGLTFSCAACHAGQLFGRAVLGMTNKRPRSNEFFVMGMKYAPLVNSHVFQLLSGASAGERKMFANAKKAMRAVGARAPSVLGLDTSLAQQGLTLAKRGLDPYATKSRRYELFPRYNELEDFISESKPAVWWNLKYKTRWLADGSIVSGNPVFTNFLWNEIGRGVDLKELEKWLQQNQQTIKELTAAVFASEAPHWSDFPALGALNLESAKRGEKIFKRRCQSCHGRYEKNWSRPEANTFSASDIFKTYRVDYDKKTRVVDVGTDPNRYLGMQYFAERLNDLAISKWMKTVIEPQEGYVPPPLVGIWSRYPYLHNGSIPTLCDLLTPEQERTKVFYQGPADNPQTDFDGECVGYPVAEKIPAAWKKESEARYDVSRPGMSNMGHSEMFVDEKGKSLLSLEERRDLIMFLKTL